MILLQKLNKLDSISLNGLCVFLSVSPPRVCGRVYVYLVTVKKDTIRLWFFKKKPVIALLAKIKSCRRDM